VGGAQVHERVDGVEPGVLREHARDEFETVREGLDGQLFAALDGVGVVTESAGDLDLRGTAASEDAAVRDGGGDDVECVGSAAFEFVNDVVGRATEQQRDAVAVDALDVEQIVVVATGDRSLAEVVGRETVEESGKTRRRRPEIDDCGVSVPDSDHFRSGLHTLIMPRSQRVVDAKTPRVPARVSAPGPLAIGYNFHQRHRSTSGVAVTKAGKQSIIWEDSEWNLRHE